MKKKLTKKAFREHLNTLDKNWKDGRYGPTKRLYGDYLYAQDRDKFNWNYKEWVESLNRE